MSARFSITTDNPNHARTLIAVLEALESSRAVSIESPDESPRQSQSPTPDDDPERFDEGWGDAVLQKLVSLTKTLVTRVL